MYPVDLLNKPPPEEKRSGGVRSGDLAGHAMYGDPLPIHLAGNYSSKNVRIMLVKCGGAPSYGKSFHKGVESQRTAATYPGTCLQ